MLAAVAGLARVREVVPDACAAVRYGHDVIDVAAGAAAVGAGVSEDDLRVFDAFGVAASAFAGVDEVAVGAPPRNRVGLGAFAALLTALDSKLIGPLREVVFSPLLSVAAVARIAQPGLRAEPRSQPTLAAKRSA